jgi:hypothetical protein
MSYCEIHEKVNCDECISPQTQELCMACGERPVWFDDLCVRCHGSDKSFKEEYGPPMCRRCGRNPVYQEGECYPCIYYGRGMNRGPYKPAG